MHLEFRFLPSHLDEKPVSRNVLLTCADWSHSFIRSWIIFPGGNSSHLTNGLGCWWENFSVSPPSQQGQLSCIYLLLICCSVEYSHLLGLVPILLSGGWGLFGHWDLYMSRIHCNTSQLMNVTQKRLCSGKGRQKLGGPWGRGCVGSMYLWGLQGSPVDRGGAYGATVSK